MSEGDVSSFASLTSEYTAELRGSQVASEADCAEDAGAVQRYNGAQWSWSQSAWSRLWGLEGVGVCHRGPGLMRNLRHLEGLDVQVVLDLPFEL